MYALVSDFDGTVTTFDMAHSIIEHFVEPSVIKKLATAEHEDGKVWMSRHMKKIKASKEEFESYVLKMAKPRGGLLETAKKAFENNIPLEIVSGGVDIYIKPFLAKMGLSGFPLYCANGKFTSGGIKLDFTLFAGIKLADFKAMRVRHYKALGYKTIYCGDGNSDYKAALEADIVFAAGNLLSKCRRKKIKANELVNFKDVFQIIGV
ncbi:hypothetical protein Emin_0373 [Elusimicrobium minutum Pei191]|uniref:Phosphoserine phosphatase n=1 Tax=Elusimicrobium minutum (strain Pei191) TaxID=445932 RepID=B2KBA8_ELUMP|nr:HAD-IB family phosphatase [Elusimicrobium minutum]ACC97930.1 hypothetical protein Emin_0373 [Elusimicrobium minutum Pei191]